MRWRTDRSIEAFRFEKEQKRAIRIFRLEFGYCGPLFLDRGTGARRGKRGKAEKRGPDLHFKKKMYMGIVHQTTRLKIGMLTNEPNRHQLLRKKHTKKDCALAVGARGSVVSWREGPGDPTSELGPHSPPRIIDLQNGEKM